MSKNTILQDKDKCTQEIICLSDRTTGMKANKRKIKRTLENQLAQEKDGLSINLKATLIYTNLVFTPRWRPLPASSTPDWSYCNQVQLQLLNNYFMLGWWESFCTECWKCLLLNDLPSNNFWNSLLLENWDQISFTKRAGCFCKSLWDGYCKIIPRLGSISSIETNRTQGPYSRLM